MYVSVCTYSCCRQHHHIFPVPTSSAVSGDGFQCAPVFQEIKKELAKVGGLRCIRGYIELRLCGELRWPALDTVTHCYQSHTSICMVILLLIVLGYIRLDQGCTTLFDMRSTFTFASLWRSTNSTIIPRSTVKLLAIDR